MRWVPACAAAFVVFVGVECVSGVYCLIILTVFWLFVLNVSVFKNSASLSLIAVDRRTETSSPSYHSFRNVDSFLRRSCPAASLRQKCVEIKLLERKLLEMGRTRVCFSVDDYKEMEYVFIYLKSTGRYYMIFLLSLSFILFDLWFIVLFSIVYSYWFLMNEFLNKVKTFTSNTRTNTAPWKSIHTQWMFPDCY